MSAIGSLFFLFFFFPKEVFSPGRGEDARVLGEGIGSPAAILAGF